MVSPYTAAAEPAILLCTAAPPDPEDDRHRDNVWLGRSWLLIYHRSYVFGRGTGADLRKARVGVSRRHWRVGPREGAWEVQDLGSTNGTAYYLPTRARPRELVGAAYLGTRVSASSARELRSGSIIRAEQVLFELYWGPDRDARVRQRMLDLAVFDAATGAMRPELAIEQFRRAGRDRLVVASLPDLGDPEMQSFALFELARRCREVFGGLCLTVVGERLVLSESVEEDGHMVRLVAYPELGPVPLSIGYADLADLTAEVGDQREESALPAVDFACRGCGRVETLIDPEARLVLCGGCGAAFDFDADVFLPELDEPPVLGATLEHVERFLMDD